MSVEKFLVALGSGVFCGFLVSIPVGPVNLTVINTALRKGFRAAFLVGLGAICAETAYAALLLAGHSSVLDKPAVVFTLRGAALVIMTGLGVRYMLIDIEKIEARNAAAAERVDERWHHPKAFLLGFILTISNLMLVLLWATLTAVLFAREWVQPHWPSRATCMAGVFVGGTIWFFLLASFVSRAHRRVRPKSLTVLARGCGVVFLLFAGLLAYQLARH